MKSEIILLTGATGEFGSYLLKQLMATEATVIALVRAKTNATAEDRVTKLLGRPLPTTIRVLSADLALPMFGLSKTTYRQLTKSVTAVIHAAAATRFNLSLGAARQSNVVTTEHMLRFANACQGLTKFGYISTAFVAGKYKGVVTEKQLSPDAGFVNAYDKSKFEAEILVRQKMAQLPIAIYRPSLVVAEDSSNHNAAVMVLQLISQGWLPLLPGLPDDPVDIIAAPDAARSIISLFSQHFLPGETYHIACGTKAPRLAELVKIAQKPQTKLQYAGHNPAAYRRAVRQLVVQQPDLTVLYAKIDCFITYLCYPKRIETGHVTQLLGTAVSPSNGLAILRRRFSYHD